VLHRCGAVQTVSGGLVAVLAAASGRVTKSKLVSLQELYMQQGAIERQMELMLTDEGLLSDAEFDETERSILGDEADEFFAVGAEMRLEKILLSANEPPEEAKALARKLMSKPTDMTEENWSLEPDPVALKESIASMNGAQLVSRIEKDADGTEMMQKLAKLKSTFREVDRPTVKTALSCDKHSFSYSDVGYADKSGECHCHIGGAALRLLARQAG